MRLSLLIPSKRPEGLEVLEDSLRRHSVTDDVELIVLVDDPMEHIEFHHRRTVIHYPPQQPLSISHMLHQCYKFATGDWVMFANDDIVCQTPEWDRLVFEAIAHYGESSLLWPDDGMFGSRLACFPIVSRWMLDTIGFFPQPYQRYKVDDTLYHVVPPEHRHFLSHIRFAHLNDKGTDGYQLPDGRVYPVDRHAASFDNAQWALQESVRRQMHAKITNQRSS